MSHPYPNITCLIITLFLLISLPVSAAETPKVYAKTMFVSGTVEVVRSSSEKPLALARGDSLYLGDQVNVGKDSKAVLVTMERRIINLAANSELKIGDPKGPVILGLGLGMFADGKGRSNIGAQATTRADESTPLLVSPRNSMIRSGPIVLNFHPLQEGERYEIEIVGVDPPFHYSTNLTVWKFELSGDKIGRDITPGQAYYLTIRHYDANGVQVQEEKDIRVGILDPEKQKTIEDLESELKRFKDEGIGEIVYLTLLAETCETDYLFDDAIRLYERIYREMAPGDAYSYERLKQLYAVTRNPTAFRALEKAQQDFSGQH